MLNAAVSKNKTIRENLRKLQPDGPHNGQTKRRAEIEMESILPIYAGVNRSTEERGSQREKHRNQRL